MSIDTINLLIINIFLKLIGLNHFLIKMSSLCEQTLQTTLSSANKWLELFTSVSSSNWIVNFELQNPQK